MVLCPKNPIYSSHPNSRLVKHGVTAAEQCGCTKILRELARRVANGSRSVPPDVARRTALVEHEEVASAS